MLVLAIAGAGWLYTHRIERPTPAPSRAPVRRPPETPRPTPLPSTLASTRPRAPRAAAPKLRITSDVPGAAVFVDRRFVGTTPVDVDALPAGRHRINASADGYEMQVVELDGEGAPPVLELRFKEIRLDAAIPAVHKHGLGSCRGTLSATPQGLQYVTDHRDHAFKVPLTAVAAVEVDYLQKNLRVTLRGGRTFNFTDPAGRPDPLLAWQQQVEKARARAR